MGKSPQTASNRPQAAEVSIQNTNYRLGSPVAEVANMILPRIA